MSGGGKCVPELLAARQGRLPGLPVCQHRQGTESVHTCDRYHHHHYHRHHHHHLAPSSEKAAYFTKSL
ncbi:hypothetical protein E2C01_037303 [Portunus trituberculatus]|uniref:Uncharacterized protein n=1 Tax=Portunus trituberculatus TaxID=210409 RepID=A0A5B7F7S5_PORTR|nr:hypothetical protein [Portunus trituberculatus]